MEKDFKAKIEIARAIVDKKNNDLERDQQSGFRSISLANEAQAAKRIQEKAIQFIGISLKSSGKVKEKLRAEEYPEEMIEACILELKDRGYIDDYKLAQRILKRHQGKKLKAKRAMSLIWRYAGIEAEVLESLKLELPDDADTAAELVEHILLTQTIDTDKEKKRVLNRMINAGYNHNLAVAILYKKLA